MKNILASITLALCITLLANTAWAEGDTTTRKAVVTAVLVQLRTENNRIKAMEKNHAYRPLEEVKKDALEVRERTIKDFTDFFKQCPVYYFMDTNSERIINKQFDGVLLNASLNPCNCHPEEPYLIVNWGYPAAGARHGKPAKDATQQVAGNGEPNGKGLIINDEQFRQLTYIYLLRYQAAVMKLSKKAKPYIYESKHYDIDYFPVADNFDKQFDNLYRSYNVSWHGLLQPDNQASKTPTNSTQHK